MLKDYVGTYSVLNGILGLQPRDKVAMLNDNTIEFFLRNLHEIGQPEIRLYFPFALKITFRRAWRNEKRAWYKPSTKRLPPTFLIDWHLPNQPTKITSVACFSSMQIFQAWEKCRLPDLKNSFYLLIFSAKIKIVSTITFNFLRD